ncbi:MAG TPA: hypothetical protein VI792_05030, partial [Candidatus Eisenbacteria bacterium]
DAAIGGGRLAAAGEIRPENGFTYSIRDGTARGLPFAALTGDTTASALGADFSLRGAGRDPATLRLEARITALEVARGGHRLEADSVGIAARDGRWAVSLRGHADGAAVITRGALEPLLPPYHAARLDLGFRGLDLARVTGDTALTADLAGTIEASAAAPDLGAVVAAATSGREAPPGSQATLRLALEPSRWRHERISALGLEARLVGSEASLEGSFASSIGSGHLAGSVRPFGATPVARISPLAVDGLDLGRALGIPGLRTGLVGQITASASGRRLEDLVLEARASLDGSSVNRARFDRLGAGAQLAGGRLEATLDAGSPADSVAVRASGALAPFAARAEGSKLAARGHARLADLGAVLDRDSLVAALDAGFEIEVSRAPEAAVWRASGSLDGRARLADLRLDTLRCEFALDRAVLRLPRLDLRGPLLRASASGRIALPHADPGDSTDLHATATLRDLRPDAPRGWLSALGVGGARIALDAAGPPRALRARGDVVATRVEYGTTWADSVGMGYDGEMRGTSLARLDARVVARGLAPAQLPERDVDARATWDGREWAVEGRARLDNGGAQDLAFRFAPGPQRSRLLLDRLDVRQGTSHIALEKPSEITLGDRVGVDDLTLLQNGYPVVRVRGAIEPDGAADLEAHVDSLDVASYMGLFGLSGMRGRLAGSGSITGRRRDPTLEAALRGTFVNAKGKPARLDARLRWTAGTLDLDTRFDQVKGGWLAVRARLPLVLNLVPQPGAAAVTARADTMSGAVEAERFDLEWFQPLVSPRLVRRLAGRLDGGVQLSGDLERPDASGGLVLRGTRVELPGLGAQFEAPETRFAFSGRTVTLEPATIQSEGGRLEASGRAMLQGPGHRTFDLRTRWSKFPVMNTLAAKIALSGDLAVSGRF